MTSPADLLSPAQEQRRRSLFAIALTITGYACYNVGDAIVKMLAASFAVPQIIVINGTTIALCAVMYGLLRRGRVAFQMHKPKWVWLRSVFQLCCTFCNTLALPHVSLTTFYMLVFTSPFWVALLSSIFLGEKIGPRRLAVIIFGFAVVGYVLRPGGDIFNIWSLLVLASALAYSFSIVTMRYLGTRESRVMIVATGAGLPVLAMLPFVADVWKPVTLTEMGLFVAMSLCGLIGITCMANAFQTAPSASAIAPFHYTQIVWGAILGYIFFAEVPQAQTMVGATLLILGGLLLIWLEARALRATPQVSSHPFQESGWFSRLLADNPIRKRL